MKAKKHEFTEEIQALIDNLSIDQRNYMNGK